MTMMREMIGLFVQGVKHIDHPELITVEFVEGVLEEWIIIAHGIYLLKNDIFQLYLK